MTIIVSDRVKQTTQTTGSGTIALSGTFGGFQGFSVIGDGNQTFYCIENYSKWEVGIGTYNSSADTLTRDTVFDSSAGGAKIDMQGMSTVFCTYPADAAVHTDGSGNLNLSGFSGVTLPSSMSFEDLTVSGNLTYQPYSDDKSFTFIRSGSGNFFQAYVDDAFDRTVAFYTDGTSAPQWRLGVKNSPTYINQPPTHGYVYGEDGDVGLYGDAGCVLSLKHTTGLNITHKFNNLITGGKTSGIFLNKADSGPSLTTMGSGHFGSLTVITGVRFPDGNMQTTAYLGLEPVSGQALYASGQVDVNSASITSNSGYFEVRADTNTSNIASHSGYFETRTDTNTTSIASNATNILANTASGVADSGYFQAVINALPSTTDYSTDIANNTASGVANSGYFQTIINALPPDTDTTYTAGSGLTLVDTTFHAVNTFAADIISNTTSGTAHSGYFQTVINALPTATDYSTDIANNTASGVANSGYFEVRADTNASDIAAQSGYFEVRVDTNETDIAAHSGYFQGRIAAVSGYAEDIATGGGGGTMSQWYLTDGTVANDTIANNAVVIVSGISGVDVEYTAADNMFRVSAGALSGWALGTFSQTDNDTTYTAGSGMALVGTTFHWTESGIPIANSASGVAISGWASQTIINSGVAVSGWADATFLKAEVDTLQTVTDRGATTTNTITAPSAVLDVLDMNLLGNGDQPTHSEGLVFYDSENHTLSLYNDEADVTLQLGQETFLRVRNNTGAPILNGSGVKITGAHGNAAPTVAYAQADSEENSQVVGLATHDIEDASFGYVTTYGIVRDVNTSTFTTGDELFLSASNEGVLVNTSPVIPNYKVSVGHVINSHAANGAILVQIGHPKLGGGDLKSEAQLNESGIPFVTTISNTTAGGSQTDPLFIYDSGNRQLQLGSGVQLLNGTPSNTSNVLYNNAGTLSWNGSAVNADQILANSASGVAISGWVANTFTEYGIGSGLQVVGSNNTLQVYGGSGHFVNLTLETDNIDDTLVMTSTEPGSSASPVICMMRDSATPADGDYLGQLKFKGRSDTGTERVYAKITGKTLDVSNTTEDGLIEYAVRSDGSMEIVARLRNDGLRIVNDNNLYIQDNGSLGVRVSPSYSLHVKDDAYIGSGITLPDVTPAVTTNKLYNNGGTLTFNGSAVGTTYTAGSGLELVGTEFNISAAGGSGSLEGLIVDKAIKSSYNIEADGATITFDMNESNTHEATLGGNRTFVFSNAGSGQKFMVKVVQDGTGSRTVTWPANIKWENGAAPTLSSTASHADWIGFITTAPSNYDGCVIMSGVR